MSDGAVLCDRCRTRPAVATVRAVTSGRVPEVRNLCEVCLAHGRLIDPAARHRSLLDQFFSRFFEDPTGRQPPGPGMQPPPPRSPQQVDITRYFSDATNRLLQSAARQAHEWGSPELDTDHLLWALVHDDVGREVLDRVGIDADAVAGALDQIVTKAPRRDSPPRLAPDAKRVLIAAYQEARASGLAQVGPEHVLLGLARDPDSTAGELLRGAGVSPEAARSAAGQAAAGGGGGAAPPTNTPTLDQYGRDLTQLAQEGRLDPVIGRAEEIEETIEVLSRRTKNNPVLIGEPGVGKTAIAEGIAQRIVSGDVPDTLEGRRLVALDLAGMLAGTRFRGEFEDRLTTVVEEIQAEEGRLLLFIDEVHTIVGAGAAEGAMDAGNILKPSLARGELHVIGATTLDEYRKNIEKDAALERRFQPIQVDEPSVADTIEIVSGLRDRYEAFHRVHITDDAISAAAELSDRYVTDRFLPDKAIDLVDQAAARVKLRQSDAGTRELETELDGLRQEKEAAVADEEYERAAALREAIVARERECAELRAQRRRSAEVTVEDIAEVVSRATGVPVAQLTQLERERLLTLEDHLHDRVVGQDEAVRAVSEAVRRNRAGLGDPDQPVGSFLFLGPTGVGKTELARALAEALFGDEDLMVRFDMSEFQERHTVSRLVGAPPGYVGYEEAGQLTERVRRRPYSVVLLDEIEKAHPDVFNLLLQLLDDGRLTDAQGRTVDFRNVVVIMTSNLGAERLQRQGEPMGFVGETAPEDAFAEARHDILQVLRREFRPEFLNRIDEIVVFRPLDREQLLAITRMMLDRVVRRTSARKIELVLTDAAVAHVADAGYDPEFGARPLARTIQRGIENELSRLILSDELGEGDRATVDARDGRVDIRVERGAGDGPALEDWEERHDVPRGTEPPDAPRLSA